MKLAVCAREGKRCMCMHAACFFSVSRGRQGGSCANTRACVRAVAFYAPLYVAARVRRSREVVFFSISRNCAISGFISIVALSSR